MRGSDLGCQAALALTLWLACGGKAVVDGGDGGRGASGPSSTSRGPSTAASTGSGPRTCDQVCADLFGCMLQPGLCPAIEPADGPAFTAGCVPQCAASPALAALVDPTNCSSTVATLKAASGDFADQCDNGF